MASMNKVIIMGNLGQDPELRYTTGGIGVTKLSVATTKTWTSKSGERQEKTEWHRIVVWGKQAENCAKYLSKGKGVLVEGELETRSWDDQATGTKRYATEIRAERVTFLGSGKKEGTGGEAENGGGDDGMSFSDEDVPF